MQYLDMLWNKYEKYGSETNRLVMGINCLLYTSFKYPDAEDYVLKNISFIAVSYTHLHICWQHSRTENHLYQGLQQL